MADLNSRNGQSGAAPSDPFEAALARARTAMETAPSQPATQDDDDEDLELEAPEDDAADDGTPSEDEPEDDDVEDDEEPDEANTPDSSEDDDDDESLPESSEAPKRSAKPDGKKDRKDKGRDSDDDDSPLSRKQRGKLITELREQLEAEQAQRLQLENQRKQQEEEEKRLEDEVKKALGSDDDYEKALEAGLNGDETAQQRALIWKANRAFFNKLVKKAEKDVKTNFGSVWWETIKGIPGIDPNAVSKGTLSEVLLNLHAAGYAQAEVKAQTKLEALEKQVETWKGRYMTLKNRAGSQRRSPVGSGGEAVAPSGSYDWKKRLLGPDGLPTEEAQTLVRQYGAQVLVSGPPRGSKAKVR